MSENNDNVVQFPKQADTTPQDADTGATVEQEVQDVEPAFGVHIVMMPDGAFAIQATGDPNLGEMQMLLSRALKSVEARMVAETVVQVQKQNQSRIITPGR